MNHFLFFTLPGTVPTTHQNKYLLNFSNRLGLKMNLSFCDPPFVDMLSKCVYLLVYFNSLLHQLFGFIVRAQTRQYISPCIHCISQHYALTIMQPYPSKQQNRMLDQFLIIAGTAVIRNLGGGGRNFRRWWKKQISRVYL